MDQEKIRRDLKDAWLTDFEIDKVIAWMKDEEAGKLYSPEEVYHRLFHEKQEVRHA